VGRKGVGPTCSGTWRGKTVAGWLCSVDWAGTGKVAHEGRKNPFSFSNDFFKYRNEINSGKILTDLKNMKFCMEVDLNIWHNFYIGNFDQR
jgi:hypothetical protein